MFISLELEAILKKCTGDLKSEDNLQLDSKKAQCTSTFPWRG